MVGIIKLKIITIEYYDGEECSFRELKESKMQTEVRKLPKNNIYNHFYGSFSCCNFSGLSF